MRYTCGTAENGTATNRTGRPLRLASQPNSKWQAAANWARMRSCTGSGLFCSASFVSRFLSKASPVLSWFSHSARSRGIYRATAWMRARHKAAAKMPPPSPKPASPARPGKSVCRAGSARSVITARYQRCCYQAPISPGSGCSLKPSTSSQSGDPPLSSDALKPRASGHSVSTAGRANRGCGC